MGIVLSTVIKLHKAWASRQFKKFLSSVYGVHILQGDASGADIRNTRKFIIKVDECDPSLTGKELTKYLTAISKETDLPMEHIHREWLMYCSLLAEGLAERDIIRVHLSRTGIADRMVEFISNGIQDDERVPFPVIMLLATTFIKGSAMEQLALVFCWIDENGDGRLTKPELREVIRVMALSTTGTIEEQRIHLVVDQVVSVADASGDGKIDFSEFVQHSEYIIKVLNLDGMRAAGANALDGSSIGDGAMDDLDDLHWMSS